MKLIKESENLAKLRTLKSVPVENAIVGYNTYEKETEVAIKKGNFIYFICLFLFIKFYLL